MNGPQALTCAEVVEKISQRAGIATRYVDLPVEAQRQAMLSQGMPEWQVTALLELQEYYTSGRAEWWTECWRDWSDGLRSRMDQFLEQFAEEYRGQAASP